MKLNCRETDHYRKEKKVGRTYLIRNNSLIITIVKEKKIGNPWKKKIGNSIY